MTGKCCRCTWPLLFICLFFMSWDRIDQTLCEELRNQMIAVERTKKFQLKMKCSYKKKVCYCANYAFWLNWSAAELQSWIPILMTRKWGSIPTWSSCTSPKNPQFTKWGKTKSINSSWSESLCTWWNFVIDFASLFAPGERRSTLCSTVVSNACQSVLI